MSRSIRSSIDAQLTVSHILFTMVVLNSISGIFEIQYDNEVREYSGYHLKWIKKIYKVT